MAHPNVFNAEFEFDDHDPPGYRGGMAPVGKQAGAVENAIKLFEVPAGESLCPYHYEYVEEWLLLLSGSLELRTPRGTESLEAGALVCFPRGPDGAHKVTNRGDGAARLLMWSSAQEPSVAVYPDSDKIGIWPGNPADELIVRRSDGNVDYYDGEPLD
jgi:uncharacterized cupin superfamily protein